MLPGSATTLTLTSRRWTFPQSVPIPTVLCRAARGGGTCDYAQQARAVSRVRLDTCLLGCPCRIERVALVRAHLVRLGRLSPSRNSRKPRLNAFSFPQLASLVFLFQLADRDARVNVVVLTGAGKAFCAGADLAGFGTNFGVDRSAGGGGSTDEVIEAHRDGGGQLVITMMNCRKLIIAAINGVGIGIGLTMTFAADLRVCVQSAKLGVPFVKRGIPCDAASSYLLPRLIGHSSESAMSSA